MHLQISLAHVELTDQIKKIIDDKFTRPTDRLLKKFNNELTTADLHLERLSFGDYKATFDMHLPGKKQIYAQNSHPDLVTTITGLREQIEKQIKKYKAELVNYSLG